MRIVHLLHEPPYPPNNGIRCDMWRRLLAFRALGHSVFAVAWASEAAGEIPSPSALDKMRRQTEEFVVLPIRRTLGSRACRIARLAQYPSYIASRIPSDNQLEQLTLRVKAFKPDLIWLEGVHPCWIALELKRRLNLPLAYRSHNIEFRYVTEQARLARSFWQKIALYAGAFGLERAEQALHSVADQVFDISVDDLSWWRTQGFSNNYWLATQADLGILATASEPIDSRDIGLLFVGSLSAPNNIAGLEWYIDKVHPLLPKSSELKLTVAGRKPSAMLMTLLANAGVTLIADPVEVSHLFARSRIMLNPILHGSGVNIKTIDMLATGRPVITTSKGARGLPSDVTSELSIADTPEAFRDAIISACGHSESIDRKPMLECVFGNSAVAEALSLFKAAR